MQTLTGRRCGALCCAVCCRCGLFLHSPFPSSEIFRTFPKREELLRSMLNADLIGVFVCVFFGGAGGEMCVLWVL